MLKSQLLHSSCNLFLTKHFKISYSVISSVGSIYFLLAKNPPPNFTVNYIPLNQNVQCWKKKKKHKWKWKLIKSVYSPNKLCQTQLTAFFCAPRVLFLLFHIATKAVPLALCFFVPNARTLLILFLQSRSTLYVIAVTARSVINANRQLIRCLYQLNSQLSAQQTFRSKDSVWLMCL
jgi:hypothetical protein